MKWQKPREDFIKKDQGLLRQHDWLSIKRSFIDVSFHVEHYPWIQVSCVLRSISRRHAGGRSQTENKGTSLDCNAFFLSVSPSSSSFNLFVRRAAAHFWSTVVCLCQMPKRLRNEEGHMKRGRVTVATVCNHMHTQKLSLLNLADSPRQWTLSITLPSVNPAPFYQPLPL